MRADDHGGLRPQLPRARRGQHAHPEKGLPFRQEVSIAKHHVANMLWRVVDRAIQVHGALGYSTDTPLERMLRHARSARLVDGADEVHLQQIAAHLMAAVREDGSTRRATGLHLL